MARTKSHSLPICLGFNLLLIVGICGGISLLEAPVFGTGRINVGPPKKPPKPNKPNNNPKKPTRPAPNIARASTKRSLPMSLASSRGSATRANSQSSLAASNGRLRPLAAGKPVTAHYDFVQSASQRSLHLPYVQANASLASGAKSLNTQFGAQTQSRQGSTQNYAQPRPQSVDLSAAAKAIAPPKLFNNPTGQYGQLVLRSVSSRTVGSNYVAAPTPSPSSRPQVSPKFQNPRVVDITPPPSQKLKDIQNRIDLMKRSKGATSLRLTDAKSTLQSKVTEANSKRKLEKKATKAIHNLHAKLRRGGTKQDKLDIGAKLKTQVGARKLIGNEASVIEKGLVKRDAVVGREAKAIKTFDSHLARLEKLKLKQQLQDAVKANK